MPGRRVPGGVDVAAQSKFLFYFILFNFLQGGAARFPEPEIRSRQDVEETDARLIDWLIGKTRALP